MMRASKKGGVVRAGPVIAAGTLLVAALIVHGCKDVTAVTIKPTPGNLGDPCEPVRESDPLFAGYNIEQSYVTSGLAACNSGICIAYHTQGRVSCPRGQDAPSPCTGPGDTKCGSGSACVAARSVATSCDPSMPGPPQCAGGACNAQSSTCSCTADAQCPQGSSCDPGTSECTVFVCQPVAGCQTAEATAAENEGKGCCVEGSSAPVTSAVCGQCTDRSAAETVYCSCRCGLADGDTTEGGTFCTCPDGFTCTEVLPYVGLGDESVTGKYCVKAGTAYTSGAACGVVQGHWDTSCEGVPEN